MLLAVRRTVVLLVGAAAVMAGNGLLPSATAASSTPVRFPDSPRGLTAPVDLPSGSEAAAHYSGQVSCSPRLMRGVRKLRNLTLATYRQGHDGGITRSCVSGGQSEHKEGRAWDWMLDVDDRAERRAAGNFLGWLTAPGPDGEPGLQARRLGVMYVIYNHKIWRSYNPGWEAYSGYSPHTDHIHLSFSWAGARGRTSFWTGRVGVTDYGPCAVFDGQMARLTRRTHRRPCAEPAEPVVRTNRPTVQFGAADSRALRTAQRRLGVSVTGDFSGETWTAVKRYQRAHDVPVTGVLDDPTWASLVPRSVQWSATAGYRPRRAARYGEARWSDVRLRRGSAGEPVAFLQRALRMPRADRNGVLGRRTAAVVRDFKESRGLRRDAVVTAEVWQALPVRRG